MENVIDNYLNEIFLFEEISYISEDISSFIKKFKPEKFKGMSNDLKKATKDRDPNQIEKIIKRVNPPSVNINKIIGVGERISSEFKTKYSYSKRVLDNSFPEDLNDDAKKVAAYYLSVKSIVLQKVSPDFKKMIKDFVDLIRYMADAVSKIVEKVPKSTIIEGVIGWAVIVLLALILLKTFLFTGFWMGLTLLAIAWAVYNLTRSNSEWLKMAGNTMTEILTRQGDANVDSY